MAIIAGIALSQLLQAADLPAPPTHLQVYVLIFNERHNNIISCGRAINTGSVSLLAALPSTH